MLKYQSIPGLQRPKAAAEASLPAGDRRIVAVAFSPDGREVYAAVREGAHLVVRRWDAGTGAEEPGGPKPAPFEWAAFAPDGARYLAGGGAPAAELRRSESGDLVRAFDTEPRATAGGLSRDGRRVIVGLAAGSAGYRARVYDADTGKAVGEYAGHGAEVRCVALSDDGKLAYSASPDRQAVWAVDTGRPAHEAGENGVTCAAFLPRAAVVVFAYRTGVISRIDLRESIQFGGFDDRHKGGVTCLAAAPDGGLVVSGGADKSVHGWEPWHRWQRWELTGLAGPVTAAAVAPDGRRFVTATERAWTVWDLPKSK
jgi:WD40 repeat protein